MSPGEIWRYISGYIIIIIINLNLDLDKTSFDFSNIFRAMDAKSRIIRLLPRVWSHDLKWVKQTLAQ